jgi:ABC-type branched-subunit amino acid transport system substrate-binding protein
LGAFDWNEKNRPYAIGLFVPMHGVAGIWGPSAIACATLAVEEINRAGGLRGRELELKCFDASDENDDVSELTSGVIEDGTIDAIVGMHTSSVRRAVIAGCEGRLPYVYTALHEGGERSAGVYALGETPERQLQPAIDMFVKHWHARRWMFIGNDYEWPWVSHRMAKGYLQAAGGSLSAEIYVPFGQGQFDSILQQIDEFKPDALLLSLVGQDAIEFNRAFGKSGRCHSILRLSCAVEENILLAIGAENTENLYVSSGYFGALTHDANMSFKERYHQRFGQRAPTLNSLGQSTYEGVHFAAALAVQSATRDAAHAVTYRGVRGISWRGNEDVQYPIHLARAEGHFFKVVTSF